MPREEAATKKACCLISEMLEEAGLDREKARALRRQLLQGVLLMCQWQLDRMDRAESAREATGGRKARKVPVE